MSNVDFLVIFRFMFIFTVWSTSMDWKGILMDSDTLLMVSRLWPIFVAFILLIVTLAQAHYRIKVLEEKVKVAFELINKITDKFSK